MFEIPNAKRVRRDELYDSSSDTGSNIQDGAEDAELRARLNAQLSKLLGLDLPAPEPATVHKAELDDVQMQGGAEEHEGKHEEEFEFRLFSTTSGTAAPTKVVLSNSDDEGWQGDGAFLIPTRPLTYYVAGEPTPERREGYQHAAVTAEDILAGAGKRAWGLERPWRVVKITVSSGKSSKGSSSVVKSTTAAARDQGDEGAKRKRPGKKRRIAMRIKSKADKAQEEQKMSKEEHLKEKKKRLNREKKLKRKAKEKQQRLAAKANGEGGEGTEAGDTDTDDSAE